MHEIHLYKPGDIDVRINFPEHWNECLLSELQHIAAAIFVKRKTQPELFVQLLRCRIMDLLPLLKKSELDRICMLLNLDDLSLAYADLMKFIFESVKLTQQPLPLLCQKFVGPDSNFENITVGEFEDADNLLMQFRDIDDSKKHEAHSIIEQFAMVLYRPVQNGMRIPYRNYRANDRTKMQFNQIPKPLLYIVKLWFVGCKSMLPEMFPLVFSPPDKGDKPTLSSDTAEPDPFAFTKLIHLGAGPKNGTRDHIREMRLLEFLFDLNLEFEKNTIG